MRNIFPYGYLMYKPHPLYSIKKVGKNMRLIFRFLRYLKIKIKNKLKILIFARTNFRAYLHNSRNNCSNFRAFFRFLRECAKISTDKVIHTLLLGELKLNVQVNYK